MLNSAGSGRLAFISTPKNPQTLIYKKYIHIIHTLKYAQQKPLNMPNKQISTPPPI